MLLILSESGDRTTDEVLQWLLAWGVCFLRINTDDAVEIVDVSPSSDHLIIKANGGTYNLADFDRVCPDCRVFTRDPQSPTAHPARCAYNPYLARWAGQAGYAPVEECGEFTPGGFVPDAERIARLLER